MDEITLMVPPAWGEVEYEDGVPVVYNRPRRFRVDGDAVWYSSAVEIRVRRSDAPGLSAEAPMIEICRAVTGDRPMVVAAAMANGVSPQLRRTVGRILEGARVSRAGNLGGLAVPAADFQKGQLP